MNRILPISLAAMTIVSTLAAARLTGLNTPRRMSESQSARFIGFRQFGHWAKSVGNFDTETVLTSQPIESGISWNELIASWNAQTPTGTGLKLEARGIYPDHTTKFYTVGIWSSDPGITAFEKDAKPSGYPRESVNGQKDADGDVRTDTLALKRPGAKLELRITLTANTTSTPATKPELKYLGLSFLDTRAPQPSELERTKHPAWGKVIEVPERAQGNYAHGAVICSATCTSMTLSYWAKAASRSELDVDVPEVVDGVYDRAYDGTGNWPFNTAFAGKFPGMRAYVSRFTSISELEDWIEAGVPVVCSVAYSVLKGKPRSATESGHLVICTGFTAEGDIILNDPALNPKRGLRVRTPYPRQQFLAGWKDSRNTVYLIYPESKKLPANRYGHWDG
jgi:hypothetical protein